MNNIQPIKKKLSIESFIFIFYCLFSFVFIKYQNNEIMFISEFYIQIVSIFFFVFFFCFGLTFSPKALLVIIILYQLSLSFSFGIYFLSHQYLMDNNLDWKTYVKWASIANHSNDFFDFLSQLKTQVFEFADMGYPIFLYPYYRFFEDFNTSFLMAVIGKSIFFSIGSYYLYKISTVFLSKHDSKIVYLLYGLNTASLFFNSVNLKESLFVTLCVFTVYNLLVYRNSKKKIYLFAFFCFLFLTSLFRIFVTFFIFSTFIASTILRKFVRNNFILIWILTGFLGFITIIFLRKILGNLAYFVMQSIGGGSGISLPVLIITSLISPIPAINQNRTTPDNFLVIGYSFFSIVLSFYAIYEIFLIFKERKENEYILLFLVFLINY